MPAQVNVTVIPYSVTTIKWTTLDPCTSLSESDSKQYTNFEFCDFFWVIQSQEIYVDKNNLKKKVYILQKTVQVVILNKLFWKFWQYMIKKNQH